MRPLAKSGLEQLRSRILLTAKTYSLRPYAPAVLSAFEWLRRSARQQKRIWHPRLVAQLPYRLVPKAQYDFDHLPPIEQIRQAMRQPIATELPSLDNKQLEAEVFGNGALGGEDAERRRAFHEGFHFERLEWLGDREWGSIAAYVVFVCAPVHRLATRSSVPNLAWFGNK
jgi:hypothetical protein